MREQQKEVAFLEELLRVYTPSGREEKLSKLIANRMKKFGFHRVRIDEVNNVFGELGSGEPSILLAGHVDTVPGWRPVKFANGQIYGKGAVDAKSALAAMIMAACRLLESRIEGRVIAAALVDEEGSGTGIKHLVRNKPRIDYAIFGEPSGVDNLTIGYKGSIDLRVKCQTSPAHASAPWATKNAVIELMRVYKAIEQHCQTMQVKDNPYRSVTTCLTQISGGTAHNVVPSKCTVTIDVRVPSSISSSNLLSELQGVIEKHRQDGVDLQVEVKDLNEPFETDKSSTLVRAFVRALLQMKGKRPRLLRKTGTGDMNVLGNAFKIPAITYGPGDSHLAHTENEHVTIDDYLSSVGIYRQAVLNLLQLQKDAT